MNFGIKISIHQLGLQEFLLSAKMRDRFPKQIMMFGMQPTSFELGVELIETNQAKSGDVVSAAVSQVERWSHLL